MYRLQKMNLVIETDKETKRDALIKEKGYTLLEDTAAAPAEAKAADTKAVETPDAKEKAASADKK